MGSGGDMVKKGRAIDPVEAVLRSLVDGNGLQDLHQDAYHELSGLVKHTVSTGGSNSVLVLGPNNVGKTTLVNKVVKEVEDTALVVKLSGLLQTDDKLALREIAVQLNLENVVTGTQKFSAPLHSIWHSCLNRSSQAVQKPQLPSFSSWTNLNCFACTITRLFYTTCST